jgi:surface antigen
MKKVMILVAALALTGCQGRVTNGEATGAITGAVIGSLFGYQFGAGAGQVLMTLAGAAAGGAAGYVVGHNYDPGDVAQFEKSAVAALDNNPDGELTSWSNQKTGVVGTITPMRTFRADDGRLCRSYHASVAVKEGVDSGMMTACRAPSGSWDLAAKV